MEQHFRSRWKIIYLAVALVGLCSILPAQNPSDGRIYRAVIVEGDTIYSLPEVLVRPSGRKRSYIRYTKLVYNIQKIYPYVILMRNEFAQMNKEYVLLNTDKERRAYTKALEQRLLKEHEKDLKKLTITQGRLLIKLVDRETGDTSYQLLKDFRGGLSATFWQGIARIFGSNLKTHYDPFNNPEDSEIETVLMYMEAGLI